MSKRKPTTFDQDEEPADKLPIPSTLLEGSSSQFGLSSTKISSSNILRLDLSNARKFNDKIKIILIESETFDEFEELSEDIRPKNFPNAFILNVEIKNDEENTIERVKEEVSSLFRKRRQMLVQINSRIFIKNENQDFEETLLNLSEKEIDDSLRDSKFSTEIFLNVQKDSRINEADFKKFLKYEKVAHKIFIYAINSGDDFCLRLLKLFDLNFPQEIQNEILNAVIESKNYETFLAFFDALDEAHIKPEDIQNILEQQNIFLKAVECKNEEVVKFLLKFDIKPSFINEAIEAALAREYFDIFDEIKNLKLDKCEDECFKMLIKKGETIISDIAQFHLSIKAKNLVEVKNFAHKYPNYRLCYGTFGTRKVCALYRALKLDESEIYGFLRANNFYTDNSKELEDELEKLSNYPSAARRIRVANVKYAQDNPDAFIGILISKCKFDAKSPVSSKDVQEMLIELSKNENLKPFFKIASEINLKIIFDFTAENVKNMVPGNTAMGLTYYALGQIFIAASREKFEFYGTFMHEITHQVLYSIYENDALPYCEGDSERENEWREIFEKEMEKFKQNEANTEKIIENALNAYNIDGSKKPLAELAVRPNHIIARYLNNPTRVKELRNMHPELFNLICDKVLPDLLIPNVFQSIQLNNDFGVIKRIEESEFKLKPSNNFETYDSTEKLILTSNVPKLALLKLINDIKEQSENKLDLKVKYIFVDDKKMQQETLKERFFDLMQNLSDIRIIFDLSDDSKNMKIEEVLQDFPPFTKVILACSENVSQNLNFSKITKNFSFNDLNDESQMKICERKIKFQGKDFEVSKVCDPIFDEIFSLLCSKTEIIINPIGNLRVAENFIPRTIKNALNEELNFDKFLNQVKDERVVLISDVAGSGKSTLLSKVYENFVDEFPNFWISFVSLIDHTKELLVDDVDIEDDEDEIFMGKRKNMEEFDFKKLKSFEEKLIEILKLDKAEEKFFIQKSSKGEVKILFDGFDEISPKCKKQTLKLFKKFQTQNQNQIFITSRTHLEQDLKDKLKVESFEIKILTEKDQIKFLTDFWKNSLPDESFIKECAQKLTQKISEMVKDHQNLIGIPLIIQGVAKLYKSDIDEQFEKEIKNLKFSEVFKKLIELSLTILAERFPSNLKENSFKRLSIYQALEYLTIVNYFGEDVAASLGLSAHEFDSNWGLEETARTGILTYDANKKVKFNHETYGQRFLSTFIENILKTFQSLSGPQIEVLQKVLTDERFEIARMFLNENFEEIKMTNWEIFSMNNDSNLSSENFFEELAKNLRKETLEKILLHKNKKSETILHLSVEFGNFETFKKVLETIRKKLTKKVQKKLIQVKDEETGRNVLMSSTYKNENSLKLLVEFVFELMEKNEIFELLNEKDLRGNNFLHRAAALAKSKEIFEFLWMKIFEIFKDEKEEFKNYLKLKGFWGSNLLTRSTKNSNLDSVKFLWKVMEENLGQDEIFALLNEKTKGGDNFLHCAAISARSKEIFEFLWMKIFEIFKDKKEELKNYLKVKGFMGRNLLMQSIENSNFDSMKFLWKVFEENLHREEIYELLNEKDENGANFLHLATDFVESKETFEFLWMKVLETFKDEKDELKNYLKVKDFKGKNLLMQSTENSNLDSINFLWKVFEENLCREEIFELLNEKDEGGSNILHCAAVFAKSKEIFEFLWMKVFENFKDEKEELMKKVKSFLLVKSEKYQQNLLHCATMNNTNFDALKLLFIKVEETLGRDDVKKMLKEKFKYTRSPLHCAIQNNDLEISSLLFNPPRKILSSEEEMRKFILEKNSENANLWTLIVSFASRSNLENLFKQIFKIFKKEEIKELIKNLKGSKGRNLLSLSTFNPSLDSIKFLWKVLEGNLSPEKIFELFHEKDENGDNFFHLAVALTKSDEIFEFLWLKVVKNFKNEKEELRSYLKLKGMKGHNCLLISITNGNSYDFIFDNIFEKFIEAKDLIYDCDDKGEMFLHWLARYGTVWTLKVAFQKFKENLTEDELKSYLLIKSERNQQNILHCAAIQNKNLNAIKFLVEKIQEYLGNDELKKMLNEKDKNECSPRQKFDELNKLEISEYIREKCEFLENP